MISAPPPIPHHQPVPGPRTLASKKRPEIARALLGHLGSEKAVRELLDFAKRNGDGQVMRARVTWDGRSWTAELFGKAAA